jgi:hypothetical protein
MGHLLITPKLNNSKNYPKKKIGSNVNKLTVLTNENGLVIFIEK